MKKLLSIAAISSFALASGNLLMPYVGGIDYSKNSIKSYGVLGGVYFSKIFKSSKIEFDAEHLFIKYRDKAIDNYIQDDVSILLNYTKSNFNLKIGNHSIFINQNNNPDKYDNVFILGVEFFKYLKYNAGLDYYYSKYDKFNVKQYSPYLGYTFGDYYSEYGSFYAKAQVNFINLSNKNITNKKNYFNYDLYLSNYIKNWTTTLKASFGKSVYKVTNGGFVVYNLGEEYKDSYGIDVNYQINNISSIKVGYTYSDFKENGNNINSSVYLISYSRAF